MVPAVMYVKYYYIFFIGIDINLFASSSTYKENFVITSTAQYCTVLHSNAQYCTVLHNLIYIHKTTTQVINLPSKDS
jgi:hypothetical protein